MDTTTTAITRYLQDLQVEGIVELFALIAETDDPAGCAVHLVTVAVQGASADLESLSSAEDLDAFSKELVRITGALMMAATVGHVAAFGIYHRQELIDLLLRGGKKYDA